MRKRPVRLFAIFSILLVFAITFLSRLEIEPPDNIKSKDSTQYSGNAGNEDEINEAKKTEDINQQIKASDNLSEYKGKADYKDTSDGKVVSSEKDSKTKEDTSIDETGNDAKDAKNDEQDGAKNHDGTKAGQKGVTKNSNTQELGKVKDKEQKEDGEKSQDGALGKDKVSQTKPQASATPADPSAAPPKEEESKDTSSSKPYCYIEIRCDTILNNMDILRKGLEPYVPTSGVILATTKVEIVENESVFDLLKRVTRSKGIQMEFRNDPLYSGAYIEGINHLYEFDCGNESGWMYKVDGWFPNYGCSRYTVKEGERIVWCYTCDLGRDVGDQYYD